MIHFCTVCDSKYLHKGLALYQSLKNTLGAGNFRLHWLCIDLDLYGTIIQELNLPEIIPCHLEDLERENPILLQARNNPPSNYGDQYSQYCWTLTPFFIDYLLRNEVSDKLMYVDSDIFFYRSPQLILDLVGEKAVGIHTHRFTPPYKDDVDTGWYNVGVMVFNNTYAGKNIAHTWAGWLLDPTNPYYKTHGSCGDQKYLELYVPLFGIGNVSIFDEDSINNGNPIFHKAPWCPTGPDPIIFYHFSHFNFDLATDQWWDHNNREKPEWRPSTTLGLLPLYQDYYNVIKEADKMLYSFAETHLSIKAAEVTAAKELPPHTIDFFIDIIGCIKIDETRADRIKMLLASIRSLAFMKDNCKFSLLMEGASYKFQSTVRAVLTECGFNFTLFGAGFGSYGKSCSVMLKSCSAPYVMTFLEDHFCVLNDLYQMQDIVDTMKKYKVDILRTSFHEVEMKSLSNIEGFFINGPTGIIYDNHILAHKQYEKHYGHRYFISVHFLTTREFAKKFWSQDAGVRPHEYEVKKFVPEWEHRVMIPRHELLASIDDGHGEEDSCLLHRPDENRFWDIYNKL